MGAFLLLLLAASALEDPVALARDLFIADANILTPYRLTLDPLDVLLGNDDGEFDLPRAREGGLDLAFMGILVPASREGAGEARSYAEARIEAMAKLLESSSGLALATSPEEARANATEGRVSLALGLENGAPFEGEVGNVALFYKRGVRLVTLVHSRPNAIGDSSYWAERPWKGLSPFGREVVAEMNRLGMVIDVAHISDEAFEEVLELSRAPVVASHSACRRFTPGWERNLSDEMIRRLARNGGVVHVTFGGSFLTSELSERERPVWEHVEGQGLSINSTEGRSKARSFRRAQGIRYATVSDVVDHVDHIVELVGIDHVGVGSGFDGSGDSMPDGLKDVSDYPALVAELLRRDYDRTEIEKVLSGNLFRVWSEVERVAREVRAPPASQASPRRREAFSR